MRSFLLTLLIAGGLALALRPLLSTGGEPTSSKANIVIAPLPSLPLPAPKPKPRRKPGRSIEQILSNPLDQ